jgi:P-type E1-E2 ATPase
VPGVRTLAVGDGANDVAMITAAHIGVRSLVVIFLPRR